MTTPAMPELPEPELGYIKTDKSNQPAFSARQMRAALQAQQSTQGDTPAAEVSDAEIARAVRPLYADDEAAKMGLPDDIKTARVILALRPQEVPMTDREQATKEPKS